MKFPKLSLRNLLTSVICAFAYPVYAYVSSDSTPLLDFLDALTITGLVFLIIGIILSMVLHGDFDISEYLVRRTIEKEHMKPFEAFKQDKQDARRSRINEPFLTGVIALAVSAVLAFFVY